MRTRLGARLMMMVIAVLCVAVIVRAQQPSTPSSERPAEAPAVAPEVIAALEKMGSFLRAQKAFTIRADTVVDEVLVDTGGVSLDILVNQKVHNPGASELVTAVTELASAGQ